MKCVKANLMGVDSKIRTAFTNYLWFERFFKLLLFLGGQVNRTLELLNEHKMIAGCAIV